jgi:hypothetical protein
MWPFSTLRSLWNVNTNLTDEVFHLQQKLHAHEAHIDQLILMVENQNQLLQQAQSSSDKLIHISQIEQVLLDSQMSLIRACRTVFEEIAAEVTSKSRADIRRAGLKSQKMIEIINREIEPPEEETEEAA